jgi:uncharacterized protein (TIGR03083 family)
MKTTELIDIVDREGRLLADTAAEAGPDAPVPTCTGWRVRELLAHLGQIHQWATRFVAEGLMEAVRPPTEPAPVDDTTVMEWYRGIHRALVQTLTDADPELECFTFMPGPSPLAFWARRQAHETAIHRVDAQVALGASVAPFDPAFAADGIEELLYGFHGRERSKLRTAAPRTLRLRATDREAVWTVRLSDGLPRTERDDDGSADCELAGSASDLYLVLWNRLPYTALSGTGDLSLARLWRERSVI